MEGGEDNNEEQFIENQEDPLTEQQIEQMEDDDDADLRELKEKL